MKVFLPRFGIETKFVEGFNADDFSRVIDNKTKAVYVESIGNPSLDVPDFRSIADAAHAHGVPLVVDNTLGAGGFFVRPIDHGADIVVHSATKWICGHGTTLGGVVIDSGKFNWGKNGGRFPEMIEPSPGYHGMRPWETFGPTTFATRVRLEILRDLGCSLNPFAAFQLIQGIETLSLRAQRHGKNALAVAKWLEENSNVSWVSYPGLQSHPSHATAKKYLRNGFGGILNFGLKGGPLVCSRVVDGFMMISNLANIGDAKTLAIHPWSTTHEQMPETARLAAGVTEDLIRISVGIEHVEDIIADLDQSISAAAVVINC